MRYLIGVGNYAGYDDSIGLRVAETIAEEGLDRGFRAVELAGNVLDLTYYLEPDTEKVLIVDTARMGKAPGEHAFFGPDDVVTQKRQAGFSTHEADVLKVLELAGSLGRTLPPVTFLGIEPADIHTEVGLSPVLESRFREYVEAAVAFFETEG
jgi:hydrogenase maturation protease